MLLLIIAPAIMLENGSRLSAGVSGPRRRTFGVAPLPYDGFSLATSDLRNLVSTFNRTPSSCRRSAIVSGAMATVMVSGVEGGVNIGLYFLASRGSHFANSTICRSHGAI